jgi:hypothetical protein
VMGLGRVIDSPNAQISFSAAKPCSPALICCEYPPAVPNTRASKDTQRASGRLSTLRYHPE